MPKGQPFLDRWQRENIKFLRTAAQALNQKDKFRRASSSIFLILRWILEVKAPCPMVWQESVRPVFTSQPQGLPLWQVLTCIRRKDTIEVNDAFLAYLECLP